MKICFLTLLIFLVGTPPNRATQSEGHKCHVYVVDVAEATRLGQRFLENPEDEKVKAGLKKVETRFPDFQTKLGEEELTTKTYTFPGQARTITASVFYTDESNIGESMTLAVVVSEKGLASAINVEGSAVTEVSLKSETDVVRTKQVIRINKVLYLVGLECECHRRSDTNAKP